MLVSKEGLPFNGKPSKIFITSIKYGTPTSLPKITSVEGNAHVESGRSKKDTIEEVRAFQQLVPVFEPRPKPNIPTTWEEAGLRESFVIKSDADLPSEKELYL